jgi:phosphatidylserine decarboxylase
MTPRRTGVLGPALFAVGLLALLGVAVLLRFSVVTDYMAHALVKDPERTPPPGRVIVAPADGTVLYVRRVADGVIPQVVKRGVSVPLVDHLKTELRPGSGDGVLIGIYMNTDGVHVNRAPIAGLVQERIVFNGPHLDMSRAEIRILLGQLLPGWVSLKKMLGLPPYDIENEAEFVLRSARETLRLRDLRDTDVYVVRIADYWVGKILTWVGEGQRVATGDRLGMITWGSQTDVFFEVGEGVELRAEVGDYVYAGETVLATY